ncbi:MAG: DUF4234 domain-containing protein [Eubacterium sp.]|nr:DUF4234 domain-containing protein [Eubacterium sp.]
MMKERNIAVCVILSIVTCGIYGIYWMYCLVEESNTMTGCDGPGGVTVILLTIVTCGIYGWYWLYSVGKRIDELQEREGSAGGNNAILYLILAIFELAIVDYCLIQNEINKRA